jgi:heptosyltransferase-2
MKPKRILIVQTAFLGDVILSTPLIKALVEIFPGSLVSFLLIPETRSVLDNNPQLSQILVYDKRKKKGVGGFLNILGQIKSHRFDLAVIPHRSLRSALLVYLAGVPQRVGFDRSAGSFLFTRKVAYRPDIHEVDRNLSLISGFGPSSIDRSPELFPSPNDLSYVRARLVESGIGEEDNIAAVAPGSVWATKRWPQQRFAEVSDLLASRAKMKVVLLGSDDDRALCQEIAGLMREKAAVLAGRLSILQTAAAISFSRVVISNDSAPVHMASAMKKPVVAIFGSTVPEFGFAPYGVNHVIVQRKLDCRPCGNHGKTGCPQEHFKCMKEITASQVFEAAASLL